MELPDFPSICFHNCIRSSIEKLIIASSGQKLYLLQHCLQPKTVKYKLICILSEYGTHDPLIFFSSDHLMLKYL